MSKSCLTCVEDSFDETENVIPKWSLEMSNYSLLPPPLNGKSKYNAMDTKIFQSFKSKTPTKKGEQVTVEVETEKPNTWIFYWGTNHSKDKTKIVGAIESYGDFKNHGLQKTNKQGKAKLTLNCPQLYRVEGKIYPRHIHYVMLNNDRSWDYENVKTSRVYCSEDKNNKQQSGGGIVQKIDTFRGWGYTFSKN